MDFLVCLPDGREETRTLHVRTETLTTPPQRRYIVQLTDKADLRFLYSLHLTGVCGVGVGNVPPVTLCGGFVTVV